MILENERASANHFKEMSNVINPFEESANDCAQDETICTQNN